MSDDGYKLYDQLIHLINVYIVDVEERIDFIDLLDSLLDDVYRDAR